MSKRNENRPGYKKSKVGWIPLHWNTFQLSDCAQLIFSNVDKKSYHGEYPVRLCNYTNVYYNEKIINKMDFMEATASKNEIERFSLKKGDVVITKDSETADDIAIPTYVDDNMDNVLCGYHLAIIRSNESILSGWFLSKLLQLQTYKNYFFTLANGVTRFGLSKESTKNVIVIAPPISEQNKLTEIISLWDQAIEKIQNLIANKKQLKKGLMKQLLTGRMRFSEFGLAVKHKCELPSGWKEAELNTIFKISKRKNSKGCKHVLTASGQNGLVDQKDFFNRSVAGKNLSNYYLLERGEFAYNRSAMKGFPYGAIKRLEKYDEGVLSTLYLCFNLKSKTVDSDFINYYFESGLFNIQLRKIIEVGARAHGLLNITATDFMHLQVQLPEQIEQTKISKTLSLIDCEIDCLKRKKSILSTQRKELLNKLLSGSIRVKINNGR